MTAWYELRNADTVESPSLLIYPDRVIENLRKMVDLAGDVARLRPHIKTHKLPEIIRLKRQLGITKFKTATIAEAELTAIEGAHDTLLAYQPVGPAAARLAQLILKYPDTRFSALVDNLATLNELSRAALDAGVQFELLIDLNVGMDRTGIPFGPQAWQLYETMNCTQGIVPGGLHIYDGHLRDTDPQVVQTAVDELYQQYQAFAQRSQQAGYGRPRLVAGGTPSSPMWLRHPEVEVGAGTVALWDFGQAENTPYVECQSAAVLLARVISRPADGLLCLDLGYKAVACESPQPRVRWFGLEQAAVVMQNEEHLVLRTELADQYPVGTVVYGVPRHICPTIAMHAYVWHVKDQFAQDRWPVVGRTRRITV